MQNQTISAAFLLQFPSSNAHRQLSLYTTSGARGPAQHTTKAGDTGNTGDTGTMHAQALNPAKPAAAQVAAPQEPVTPAL
jgi:hypothetical protein